MRSMSDLHTLRVDHAALDHAAAELARAVAASEQRIERLAAELRYLDADWYGEAQEAYLAAKAVWEAAQQQMRVILADLGRTVVTANAAYRAADHAAAAAFR